MEFKLFADKNLTPRHSGIGVKGWIWIQISINNYSKGGNDSSLPWIRESLRVNEQALRYAAPHQTPVAGTRCSVSLNDWGFHFATLKTEHFPRDRVLTLEPGNWQIAAPGPKSAFDSDSPPPRSAAAVPGHCPTVFAIRESHSLPGCVKGTYYVAVREMISAHTVPRA